MALEALSSNNELLNFIIYDTISATPYTTFTTHEALNTSTIVSLNSIPSPPHQQWQFTEQKDVELKQRLGVQGRKITRRRKRRRKQRVCMNKEEAEAQRMTHIAVERNRRKQMNQHLAVLKTLMPDSYVQRGDQASIVGGAIEFVKEMEHLLQSLEAKRVQLLNGLSEDGSKSSKISEIFSQMPYNNKYRAKTETAIAEIEVTLIETHANIRILCRKSHKLLSKLVTSFQTLHLTILHINVTSMDPLVILYSISAQVEEECPLTCVDDIAEGVHQVLIKIEEEEAALCC